MDDQPDIRLIDAHAEGIRRSQNPHSPPAKVVMHELPFLIRETGMVVADRLVRLSQPFRDLLHRPARGAIDEDCASFRLANQPLQRRQFLLAGLAETNRQGEIGPTEARDQSERIAERQPVAQIRLNTGRGRGSQSQAGRIREFLAQAADFKIVGPEIVAPLGNAVRFVDHQQRDPQRPQELEKPLMLHPFRRQIEQLQPPLTEILNHAVLFKAR